MTRTMLTATLLALLGCHESPEAYPEAHEPAEAMASDSGLVVDRDMPPGATPSGDVGWDRHGAVFQGSSGDGDVEHYELPEIACRYDLTSGWFVASATDGQRILTIEAESKAWEDETEPVLAATWSPRAGELFLLSGERHGMVVATEQVIVEDNGFGIRAYLNWVPLDGGETIYSLEILCPYL